MFTFELLTVDFDGKARKMKWTAARIRKVALAVKQGWLPLSVVEGLALGLVANGIFQDTLNG
jgi:hypothetical protein